MRSSRVFLCAICNVSSGSCNEDCAFCTQSAKYRADIERYRYKAIEDIVQEAKLARESKAVGFCLVTSGKEITETTLEYISKAAKEIKRVIPSLHLIACNGLAKKEELEELKRNGIDSYNHNLESSREFYSKICTTHTWQERYETCVRVKEVGLHLCSGGILGMGESKEDRYSLVKSLKSLNPHSVALNFYHPNRSLPLEKNIDIDEAFFWIRYIKEQLSGSMLMVAGGREVTFKDRDRDIFENGADSIVIGNYLTTGGKEPHRDIEMIKELGLEIVKSCDE
jgi:biotin synthase